MKKEFKNFIKEAQAVRLSEKEKSLIRSRIMEFISFNPIRSRMPRLSERSYISIFEVRHFAKAAAFVLIIAVVAGGSGVSFAAQNSLPGDALYPIKVNVNEAIEESLARSPEARVAIQSKKVERRLEEAQTLSKDNKLSNDNQKIVIAQIEEHIEELEKEIDILRGDGEVEIVLEATAKLTPVMEAHKDILEKSKNGDSEGENEGTENLIAQVESGIRAVEMEENAAIADVSAETEIDASTTMMMSKAEDLEDEIKDDAKETIAEINDDIKDLVKSRIDSAREKIKQIKAEQEAMLETEINIEETPLSTPVEVPTATKTVVPTTSTKATGTLTTPDVKTDAVPAEQTVSPLPVNIETAFNVTARINLAEDLLKEATRLYNEEEWREALSLAQEVNRIASEIETHTRLKELDLAKAKTKNVEMEASVIKSTN